MIPTMLWRGSDKKEDDVQVGGHLSSHFARSGGLGLTTVSAFAKRLSLIFFALFFLGFLALVGFAYLVSSAVNHSELQPAFVAIST